MCRFLQFSVQTNCVHWPLLDELTLRKVFPVSGLVFKIKAGVKAPYFESSRINGGNATEV